MFSNLFSTCLHWIFTSFLHCFNLFSLCFSIVFRGIPCVFFSVFQSFSSLLCSVFTLFLYCFPRVFRMFSYLFAAFVLIPLHRSALRDSLVPHKKELKGTAPWPQQTLSRLANLTKSYPRCQKFRSGLQPLRRLAPLEVRRLRGRAIHAAELVSNRTAWLSSQLIPLCEQFYRTRVSKSTFWVGSCWTQQFGSWLNASGHVFVKLV